MNLRDYLESHGVKMNFFSKKIGTTNMTLHNIVNKGIEPKLSLAIAIEDATDGKVKCRDLAKKHIDVSRPRRKLRCLIEAETLSTKKNVKIPRSKRTCNEQYE